MCWNWQTSWLRVVSRQGIYFEWNGLPVFDTNSQGFLGNFSRVKNLKSIYAGVLELADELASGRVTTGYLFWVKRTSRFRYKLARVSRVFQPSKNLKFIYAGVLELADELASGASVRKDVWVQIPPPAPTFRWIGFERGLFRSRSCSRERNLFCSENTTHRFKKKLRP